MGQVFRDSFQRVLNAARGFGAARGGNVAMIWALVGSVLIGLVGLTLDFTRAQMIRTQLQNAADGAALVAERSSNLSLSERETLARAFFDAEAGDYANVDRFVLTPLSSGGHRVEVSYVMDTGLSRVVEQRDWTIGIAAEAEAQASPPIEVVMALDNTGSMKNDMETLKEGAEDLARFLLTIDGDTVSVGLVPFVAQVNIGNESSHLSWMDTTGINPHHGELLEDRYIGYRAAYKGACTNASRFPTTYGGFAVRWLQGPVTGMDGTTNATCYAFAPSSINIFDIYNNLPSNAQWGGCVEARPPPYDINDTPPSTVTPASLFVPFFSLDEGNDDTDENNWITSTSYDRTNMLGLGSSFTAAPHVRTAGVYKYRSGVPVSISTSNSSGRGPNRGCPTPIVPLTTELDDVIDAIDDMDYWNGGGTNQIEGLAWAWRVLSPGTPFTEGRPYDDPIDPVRKVIVLFTDGDNTSINSDNDFFESNYAALNHRSLWRIYQYETVPAEGSPGIPSTYQRSIAFNDNRDKDDNKTVDYMNDRQEDLCENIKDAGIEIYTIGFRITEGGDAELLLQSCATQDGEHYFHADDSDELLAAFTAIGSGIGDLRITN